LWDEVEATFDPHRICNDGQHCRNSDTSHPLAVDGPARTQFIRSAHDQCVKVMKDRGNDASLTRSQLEFYCTCAGTAVADAITGAELANATDASMKEKGISVAPVCRQKALARD
jgi:hypothetical protein